MQDSFTLREATADDVPELAALHVKTFKQTHGWFNAPTIKTRLWQWQMIFEEKDDTWFCIVIEKEGEGLIGFAKGQSYHHSDHPNYSGLLNKIYLLRKFQKIGLGRRLICRVASEFIQRDIHNMLLFGDAKNRSNKFYERMGGEKLLSNKGEFHGGYGWKDLKILLLNCEST